MDGGIAEAALLGAAMGGGSAAVTGGDPLKGALLGGLTGGVGSGISGAMAGAAPAATTAAGTTAAGTGLTAGAGASTVGAGLADVGAERAAQTMAMSPELWPAGSTAANQATTFTGGTAVTTPNVGSNVIPTTAGPSLFNDPFGYISNHKMLAASSGLAGATGARKPIEMPEKYHGALSRFRYDPDYYTPQRMATGGIAALPAAQGKYMRGPGDGMSDSIPAMIDGQRRAQLATNEFVVPADVVSGLGNGSSDAGAKQLYAMMDRVRTSRTGKRTQPKAINARAKLPA